MFRNLPHGGSRPRGTLAAMRKLVVAHAERKAQRALQRLVGATLAPVEVVADSEALTAALDPEAIVVIDAAIAQQRPQLRELPARAWIAVPGDGSGPAEQATIDALLAAGWAHVIAHPMPLLAEELLATVQKLRRDDVFGVEKYVAWGAEVRSYTLADTTDRDDAVTTLAADVVSAGLPDRISSMVSVIADELLANAMYVAPVDEHGTRFRVDDDRGTKRALRGRDAVTLRWATDARYLAIEVQDRWGSYDPRLVAPGLASSNYQSDATGRIAGTDRGLGLALVYACCNQLVLDIAPSQLTEVIALLDVRYKPTELGRAASFHAFTGHAP